MSQFMHALVARRLALEMQLAQTGRPLHAEVKHGNGWMYDTGSGSTAAELRCQI